MTLARRIAAETVGTAFLLDAVVGSGIMGERLAGGNVAIALLANTSATGAMLVALILTFGPISGAHFNPAVTLADASQGGLPWREVPGYLAAQITGSFAGVAAAHLMFSEPMFFASRHARSGTAQLFSEFVATFGLLSIIWGCARLRSSAVPFAVGAYITAAYWFTASTSFCQSGGDAGPRCNRHVLRYTTDRCSRLYRCAVCGRRRSHSRFSLARSIPSQGCSEGGC
jgi:glycerol uptake facilitator-like aquaporin